MKTLYSVELVADLLSVTKQTVAQWIAGGRLPVSDTDERGGGINRMGDTENPSGMSGNG